jgi:putative ABC transport system ATP-binding protein
MEMYLILQVCFDSRTVLRTDLMRKRDIQSTFLISMKNTFASLGLSNFCRKRKRQSNSFSESLQYQVSHESMWLLPTGNLVISTSGTRKSTEDVPVLSVVNLSYGFEMNEDEESIRNSTMDDTDGGIFRTLFENVSFELYPGSTALVSGPSGVGKSSLLRILAGLVHGDTEKIVLVGRSQQNYVSMPLYRKKCRYVPQTKIDIPGTPLDFMAKISSFKSWKNAVGGESPSHSEIKRASIELIQSWGMNTKLLDSEWNVLSGGESQRILVAISLASLPHGGVILLDESTSALDLESKMKVENSVQEYCTKKSIAAVWISHDPGQQDRMKQK